MEASKGWFDIRIIKHQREWIFPRINKVAFSFWKIKILVWAKTTFYQNLLLRFNQSTKCENIKKKCNQRPPWEILLLPYFLLILIVIFLFDSLLRQHCILLIFNRFFFFIFFYFIKTYDSNLLTIILNILNTCPPLPQQVLNWSRKLISHLNHYIL